MINAGIVGISGYSGCTLLEILLKHKDVRVPYVSANNTQGAVTAIWPHLAGRTDLICQKYDENEAILHCDVVFLAVPHTTAMAIAPSLLKAKKRVIDLSGDYRLKAKGAYKTHYGKTHTDVKNLKTAVYGLPELYREKIKKANLISNPGCYPTCAILALAPAITSFGQDILNIAIDAKSGTTGAGRKATLGLSFSEVNENFKAYKVLHHQHEPEIEAYLSKIAGGSKTIDVHFVPHLLPVKRGILSTIYAAFKGRKSLSKIHSIYKKFYKTEKFVRVLEAGQQPELKNVVGTNFCDIGLAVSSNGKMLVVTSAIDNLMKGASGQAVQNLNIMCGFNEVEGLL